MMADQSDNLTCPECGSSETYKNGKNRQGKQKHLCKSCGRQFITNYNSHRGYSDEFKRECLTMYTNGMGLRAIERVKGVHHTTLINWVKQVGEKLPDAYLPEQVPQVGELDELQTFVGSKKNKIWLWTARLPLSPGNIGVGNWKSK